MKEVSVPYEVDGRQFEGVMAFDDSVLGKRSVLFMQPDWAGVSSIALEMARAVAGDRYIVLIADMYGAGHASKPKTFDELMAGMQAVHNNLPFTLACGGTAFRTMLAEAERLGLTDSTLPKFAVGYCAGGGFLLEQARAGEDLDALAVMHVTNPNPVVAGTPCNIKGAVLAVHGAGDVITPKSKIDELAEELTAAGVDWQVTVFGEGIHAFCVPKEDLEVARYDEKLCRSAYRMMHDFFRHNAQNQQ